MRPGMRAKALVVLMSGGAAPDVAAPTVVITSSESSPTAASPIPITVTFSEEVTGFVVGDLTVGNGAASNFATADNIVFTVDITPTAAGAVTVDIDAAVCQDLAGNDNEAAAQYFIESTRFLTFTATTTGAQTLTLAGLTVAAGETVTIDWGDGNSNMYTAGSGARTHDYAGAGTWVVSIENTPAITLLDLRDTKISMTISSSNPLPTGLTSLYLVNLAGLTYNANTNPLPTGLTVLGLGSLTGLTYNANTNPLPTGLTSLNIYSLPGLTYNANTNPLPTGLTFLNLYNLTGLTYNANTNPLPTGLTYLGLNTLAGLTWEINSAQPWPQGATAAAIFACNNVTITEWTDNAIRSIQWESSCNAAKVDSILQAIWANKANFTYATPTLDLIGGGNLAASGIYQAASPPTTGQEYAYDLVNGAYTSAGPEWTVQVNRANISILGDSISVVSSTWAATFVASYGTGLNANLNHAVGGQEIEDNMATQVLACVNDNASVIIIALGTNDEDDNLANLQAVAEQGIIDLKASNPSATLYWMNVLPRWTAASGGTEVIPTSRRNAIAAACTAQGITCWDTYTTPWILQSDTVDGVHPNAGGHTKIANEVLALVA